MANQIGMTIEQLGSLALKRSPSAYQGMSARQVGELLVRKHKAYSGGKTFSFMNENQEGKVFDYRVSKPTTVGGESTSTPAPESQADKTARWTETVRAAVKRLQSGESWGTVWQDVKSQWPTLSDGFIDGQLGGDGKKQTGWAAPGAYEKYKQQKQDEKIQAAKETAGGIATGAAKGVGSTLSGLSSIGQTLLDSTFGAATRWGLGKFGVQTQAPVNAGQLAKEKYFTPETSAEKIGFGAEQLAEWFIPAGTAGKIVSKLPVLSKVIKGAGTVEKVAQAAKTTSAVSEATRASQALNMIKGTGSEALKATKVVAPAAKAVEKVAEKVATKVGKETLTESLKLGTLAAGQEGKVGTDAAVSAALPVGLKAISPVTKYLGSKLLNKSFGGTVTEDMQKLVTSKSGWIPTVSRIETKALKASTAAKEELSAAIAKVEFVSSKRVNPSQLLTEVAADVKATGGQFSKPRLIKILDSVAPDISSTARKNSINVKEGTTMLKAVDRVLSSSDPAILSRVSATERGYLLSFRDKLLGSISKADEGVAKALDKVDEADRVAQAMKMIKTNKPSGKGALYDVLAALVGSTYGFSGAAVAVGMKKLVLNRGTAAAVKMAGAKTAIELLNAAKGVTKLNKLEMFVYNNMWKAIQADGGTIQEETQDFSEMEYYESKAVDEKSRAAVETLKLIDEILSNPSLAAATGASSLAVIPGTGAYDVTKQIESLKSQETIDNMGKMKGVLSDSDMKILTSAATSLDVGMKKDDFIAELERIKTKIEMGLDDYTPEGEAPTDKPVAQIGTYDPNKEYTIGYDVKPN